MIASDHSVQWGASTELHSMSGGIDHAGVTTASEYDDALAFVSSVLVKPPMGALFRTFQIAHHQSFIKD